MRPARIRDTDDDRAGVLAADRARNPQRIAVLAQIDKTERHRLAEIGDGVLAVDRDRVEPEFPQHRCDVSAGGAARRQQRHRHRLHSAHGFTR